jgi:hypothetical protein
MGWGLISKTYPMGPHFAVQRHCSLDRVHIELFGDKGQRRRHNGRHHNTVEARRRQDVRH